MAITHEFKDFTILLIKIVSPQNKIRIHITKKDPDIIHIKQQL